MKEIFRTIALLFRGLKAVNDTAETGIQVIDYVNDEIRSSVKSELDALKSEETK